MKYVKIQNNQIIDTTDNIKAAVYPSSIPRPFPDVINDWVKVVVPEPAPAAGQRIASSSVQMVSGVPTVVYVYEDLPVEEKKTRLENYGFAFENSPLTHEGFTEDGAEVHRRNVKETIDFLRELGESAPAQIPWNSPTHGIQVVTLEILLGWLLEVGTRRYKRFIVQSALIPNLAQITDVEAAFDAAYAASE